MKKTICVLFFILTLAAYPAEDNLTEISCEMIRTVSIGRHTAEKHEIWGFYIDEIAKDIFYAPSGNNIPYAYKIFDDNQITLKNVNFMNYMQGNININRYSGQINMYFNNEDASVNYVGTCKKLDKTRKSF